ncbi:MAG: VCBS repeat-containing protein, partial [Acidobacteria bacterium]|nr:VCBS repeat-containing protein [Acidobacteriota bacterium]
TLIVTGDKDNASANRTREYIESQGGRIAVMAPPHVMLGWIPQSLMGQLTGKHGIELVTYQAVDFSKLKYQDRASKAACDFFNAVVNGSLAQEAASADRTHGEPLAGDGLTPPAINREAYRQNLERAGVQNAARLAEAPTIANSDSMTGTVAVNMFFVESNGATDPNTYTWTATDQQNTYNRVVSSLTWWSQQAPAYGQSVTFTVSFYGATDAAMQQPYEPITHASSQDSLWIASVMANLGYTSGTHFDRVTAFNTWLKGYAGTNWAYSMFIGYNPPVSGAPSTFTNGYFAYAYLGGPYSQLLFSNDGWGATNFGLVATHETGHIFWACDEYYQAGYGGCQSCGACASFGPRPTITNGNCEFCSTSSVTCMMKSNSYALCPYTPPQIGWIAGTGSAKPVADFDGDGKSDVSVYRPSNGGWYYLRSTNGIVGSVGFGAAGDIAAPGDFDGDGKADQAVFRPSTGYWYLNQSTAGFSARLFGQNGDLPAAGDYDGDGKTDIAVFRPSAGAFYIQRSTLGFTAVPFGTTGDRPAVGDYDGDGKADVAVYRSSNGAWYLQRSTAGFIGISFGTAGDYPAEGDYDGDHKTDIAVFRPSTGYWYVNGSTAGFSATLFGNSQDRPAPGDFDGDGKSDFAVFRTTTGGWYIMRSTAGFLGQQFGTTGDLPVPSAYIPQ